MKLQSIRLTKFKRFDDLTIDLGPTPAKIIALVGPNGCGKSSVFDAFEQILQDQVGASNPPNQSFFSKSWFDAISPKQSYSKQEAIKLVALGGQASFSSKSFYVRSAYRYTSRLNIESIRKTADVLTDTTRPGNSISLDQRLQNNYERLHGRLMSAFYQGDMTGSEVRQELVGRINQHLEKVLEIKITDLGNVAEGTGQLFFEKGTSKNFPFENLSAGEKEVVDMLIDLEVKRQTFDDTVYCIDEPELHLNTAIQRKLLKELVSLIPDNCQLWIATHSIGFLRALQQELAGQSQVLDFSEKNYFDGTQILRPLKQTRADWKRIFSTALEDLTGLLAPKIVIYCEGRPDPTPGGDEQGLDALIYNQVFESEFPDVIFISSGGGGEPKRYLLLALKVLGKALDDVQLLLLKDKDNLSDVERAAFLAESPMNRMLKRREIENYLLDAEIVKQYCLANETTLDLDKFHSIITDIANQDLKVGQTIQLIAQLAGFKADNTSFKKNLAGYITVDTSVYAEIKANIFSTNVILADVATK